MSIVHPVLMAVFFFLIFRQVRLGQSIKELKVHSPDFAESRKKAIAAHRGMIYPILFLGFGGMLGGAIVATQFMGVTVPFQQTYGHPFFGLLGLAAIIAIIILGFNIKNVRKPKIQERFLNFHTNIAFVLGFFCLLSLATGIIILVSGPSAIN
ncbi:MAG: hypothetical protein HQM10_23005 [Candidatus Riflebacteria bacterium]|nr:hypothetical protein [Candidatus Riflebacteria bacterium]